MSNVLKMLSRGGAVTAETDPNFNQTVLLLHGDGTNGAQNNTFLDGSTNNFTITRAGNTTQGTFSPFSLPDGYWSSFFDGTNDRLTIADNAVLRPGTGNFTIEAWVYRAAAGAAHTIFAKGASTPTGFVFGITSSDTLRFTNTSSNIDSTGTVAANTWVHVAVVREGTGANQLKLYINGVQDGQGTVSTDFNQTEEARIGENRGATDDFNGYISNFRYVVGSAIYTVGFTPSTLPLTTTSQGAVSSEVELLTCQSNSFVDNSTNGFTVTPVNNTRVTPFSPFSPTAAYSAGTNGGSGYFDGNDHLSVAYDAALDITQSDFTFEIWLYRTAGAGSQIEVVNQRGGTVGWLFRINTNNTMVFAYAGGSAQFVTSVSTLQNNTWTHIAATRSGTTMRMFINGIEDVVSTTGTGGTSSTGALYISRTYNAASGYFTGYMSNLRIIKGTALYTSNFTPPTAPITNVSNTSLLLNFTNAGIFDNTGKNNLETVGNAQIDTTTKKYGTGSIKFDGTGDYLIQSFSNPDLTLGSGDWTIECWLYLNALPAVSAFANIFDQRPSSGNGVYPNIRVTNNGRIEFFVNSNVQIQSNASTINTGVWYFISISKASGSTKMFVDGTQVGSTYTDSNNYLNSRTVIAGSAFTLGVGHVNGYIDDLRITKGVARYTANFTPPTKELPNQ